MDGLVFRNDDVSSNSSGLKYIYDVLTSRFPNSTIYSCTTVLSKTSPQYKESVYPELPLRGKPLSYFFDVDRAKGSAWNVELDYPNVKICSHGLWHFDHTEVDSQLMTASIVSSCRLLETDIFVPPFNRWNSEVELVCAANNITMIKSEQDGWKSFEHNKFDFSHNLWYFHSWKWNQYALKEYLGV